MLKGKKRKKIPDLIDQTLENGYLLHFSDQENGLLFLRDFFQRIRPERIAVYFYSDKRLNEAIKLLIEHPPLLQNLKIALLSQVLNTDLVPSLTQSGMMQSQGFTQEFFQRISYKFLPPYQEKDDFLYVLNHIFYKKSDYLWVEHISRESWINFFEVVGYRDTTHNPIMVNQLLKSLLVLSYRVADLGLNPNFVEYLPADNKNENPFVMQNMSTIILERSVANKDNDRESMEKMLAELDDLLLACVTCLKDVQNNQSSQGASVSLTYTTLIIETCIERLRIIVDGISEQQILNTGRFVDFFRMLVRNEKRKSSVRELFSLNFGYVAYQIAEHKGHKGDKYITSTRKSWFRMIYTAGWGGVIICFVAFFKMLLHHLKIPPFWMGITYSVNYSVGFVAIEETGSTLATKQPAFTASAVASSLDTKKTNGQPNLYQLAVTVARVMRSQNASFIGNLMLVLPGSYLIAWIYDKVTGHKLVEGLKAFETLQDQHPWHSLSLLYACNAGVFLFVTGLLAGYIGNKMKYEHVAERIVDHPILSVTIPKKRLAKLGNYIEHHSGALAGNIAFGFLMGMSGVVTQIFGVNFDVRHVTIASANVAYGIYGYGWSNLTTHYVWELALGLFGIGFFNFAVSFFLAFFVAVRSRGIKMRDYPEFLKILWSYFRKYPLRFVFPGKDVVATE